MLPSSVMNLLLVSAALACAACGTASTDTSLIALSVESQDNIVSENGTLELTEGLLFIRSISLIGTDGNTPLLGPVSIDLAVPEQELPLRANIAPGEYTGLHIELAPPGDGAETLDAQVELVMTQESVRATSMLTMSGNNEFPEGPRTITESTDVELDILLRGMFFYLAPISDAVDGHYEAGENQRDFLTMDLIGMFDLRVLP